MVSGVSIDYQNTSEMIRLGSHILAASYNTIDSERLRTIYSPKYVLRTAWPLMIVEFGDLVSGMAVNDRRYYSSEEIRRANKICDIFSRLPYTRNVKKMVLVRARTHKNWRELSTLFKISPWQEVRRQCAVVLIHLIQQASIDPYRVRWLKNISSDEKKNFTLGQKRV